MTVDTYSGVITWTPQGADQIGNIAVTIRATNYAGFVDWSYTIHAAPPPMTTLSNLTLVAVTDTSFTFTWTPENPLVGQVTYVFSEGHFTGGGIGAHWVYVPVVSGLTNPAVTISGLAPGSAHRYVVEAVVGTTTNADSAVAYATTTAPQPPQNPQVTGITSSTISFAWMPSPGPAQSPNYSMIASYSISQYVVPGGTVVPKVTGITGTSGTVTGITPSTSAFWEIQAVDTQGFSSSSTANLLAVSNPVPAPAVLSGASQTGTGGLQFAIQIAAAQTTYVQTSTNLGDPTSWVTIATNPPSSTAISFTDTNAETSPMLFYRVVSP
jgi:hypothetical protein